MSELNGKLHPRPGHIPGVVVNLGGNDLVLAPFGLRLLREYQDKMKALIDDKTATATPEQYYDINVDAILASLLRNYPDLTREEVEPLLDSANVEESIQAILSQSGLKRVTPGELTPGK